MRVLSTDDVPLECLSEFGDDLGPEFEFEIEEGRVVLLSVQPPSWIHLIADSSWWVSLFSAAAALYVAEIVKEAAKESWKNRAKVAAVVAGAANKLKLFAEKIVRLKQKLPERTEIVLALPVPSDYFGVRLALSTQDADLLAVQIALFVTHMPALVEVIRDEKLDGSRVASGLFLELLENGDLKVVWFNRESLERESLIIPLRGQ